MSERGREEERERDQRRVSNKSLQFLDLQVTSSVGTAINAHDNVIRDAPMIK